MLQSPSPVAHAPPLQQAPLQSTEAASAYVADSGAWHLRLFVCAQGITITSHGAGCTDAPTATISGDGTGAMVTVRQEQDADDAEGTAAFGQLREYTWDTTSTLLKYGSSAVTYSSSNSQFSGWRSANTDVLFDPTDANKVDHTDSVDAFCVYSVCRHHFPHQVPHHFCCVTAFVLCRLSWCVNGMTRACALGRHAMSWMSTTGGPQAHSRN